MFFYVHQPLSLILHRLERKYKYKKIIAKCALINPMALNRLTKNLDGLNLHFQRAGVYHAANILG